MKLKLIGLLMMIISVILTIIGVIFVNERTGFIFLIVLGFVFLIFGIMFVVMED